MENRLYTAKKACKVRFRKKLSFIISNSAIINESVNRTQLIYYLHHLYTLFFIIGGFTLRASRTLDWTRTLVFWVYSVWLKLAICHCVIEINKYVSDLLQCTMLQNQSANMHLILTWGGFRVLSFFCLCYLVASFLSLDFIFYIRTLFYITFIFMFSINHPGNPFFKSRGPTRGSRPRVWKPLV